LDLPITFRHHLVAFCYGKYRFTTFRQSCASCQPAHLNGASNLLQAKRRVRSASTGIFFDCALQLGLEIPVLAPPLLSRPTAKIERGKASSIRRCRP
jgi:hypothetical protein